MEQAKQTFLKRYHEVRNAYYRLYSRPDEIRSEMNEINKALKQNNGEVSAESLMADDSEERRLKMSTIDYLNHELSAIQEKRMQIDKKGGVIYLCKTDETLNQAAKALLIELEKQSKEDEKRRLDIEKRYNKAIEEILQLEKARNEFNDQASKKLGLFSIIRRETETQMDDFSFKFKKAYTFSKPSAYYKLGQAAQLKG